MRNNPIILCFLLLIIVTISVQAVPDYPKCANTQYFSQNCTLLTPSLICSTTPYTYDVININGTIVTTGDMAELNDTTYYFNFTETKGDYLVRLCDNTTREMSVTDGTNSSDGGSGMEFYAVFMLLPMILGLMMLFSSWFLGDEHIAFKIFLFMLAFVCFFASLYIALVGSTLFFATEVVQNTVSQIIWIFGFFMMVLFLYWLVFIMVKLLKAAHEQKMNQKNRLRLGHDQKE